MLTLHGLLFEYTKSTIASFGPINQRESLRTMLRGNQPATVSVNAQLYNKINKVLIDCAQYYKQRLVKMTARFVNSD